MLCVWKQEMYFEAVQEIFVKLNDPKIPASNADNLRRQLIVLDPNGSIRDYVISGGARPDVTDLVMEKWVQLLLIEVHQISHTSQFLTITHAVSYNFSSERYAKRLKKRQEDIAQPLMNKKAVEKELQLLLKDVEKSLVEKYDGATRKRISDKIKVCKKIESPLHIINI